MSAGGLREAKEDKPDVTVDYLGETIVAIRSVEVEGLCLDRRYAESVPLLVFFLELGVWC
jgi:hypothetical protein